MTNGDGPWQHIGVIVEARPHATHITVGIDGNLIAQHDFGDMQEATLFIAQTIWGYLQIHSWEQQNEHANDQS